jgi:PadR family transcriptional regulator PadR
MRRKAGGLVPLEMAICLGASDLRRKGQQDFHGYEIAKHLGDETDRRLLTAYGTLYRALGRLEKMGLLKSRWEDPQIAADENRPGRRLYKLTKEGERAAADAREAARAASARKATARARRRPLPA